MIPRWFQRARQAIAGIHDRAHIHERAADWNEDSFPEEMTPLLLHRPAADSCAELVALHLIADGQIKQTLSPSVAVHASTCPACQDLQRRLESFDDAIPIDERDWPQTEKRLDNWFNSFLTADRTNCENGRSTAKWHFRRWMSLATLPNLREMKWGLATVGALLLIVCAFFVGRFSATQTPELLGQVTRPGKETIEPVSPKKTAENRGAPAKPGETSQPPPQSALSAHLDAGRGANRAARTLKRLSPPVGNSTAPQEDRNVSTAMARPTKSEPENPPTSLKPPEKTNESTANSTELAQQNPNVENRGDSQRAQPSSAGASPNPAALRFPASTRPATLRTAPGFSRSPGPAAGLANRALAPLAVPAPLIRFDAGTRVWIVLKSVTPRPDGVSDFYGLVLLPVTQSGTTLLSRNTEVTGNMVPKNGKTSVQILEFSSAGGHYKLRGASGEVNLRLLGAGDAVKFDAGRVLETWMASNSLYERVPGTTSTSK